jgi:hypothetical protein
MNWLFPAFLSGTALIGLPVILHLLRRKPRKVIPFPSLRFLGASALRDTRRNRLLRWLTLFLRCMAIGLLCVAFARPFWGGAPASNRQALVIALDNSMSEQTRGRWNETQRWAESQLDELKPGDLAALLVMQPDPTWIVPMTGDLDRVRKALGEAKPGYDKTRYAQSLRLAGDTLVKAPAGTKTLAWAADEQRVGWRGTDLGQKLPAGVNFRFIGATPAPAHQAAIVSVRKPTQSMTNLEVTIRLFHPASDRRELTIVAGDKQIARQSVSLKAGDNKFNIPCALPADAPGIRVALDPDDLAADDSAWIVSALSTTNILLLDAPVETDFLAHALRSTHKLTGAGLDPGTLPDGAWPVDSCVALRNEGSFRDAAVQRLDQFCNAGGATWIFVDGSVSQKEWLKQHGIRVTARTPDNEPWHLRDWNSDHPALAAFAGESLLPLLEIEFYRGFNLSGDSLAPIANWPDGKAALAEIETGAGKLLVAGFSPNRDSTDWMVRPSFVPFVHCAARWLGSFRQAREDWRVGDTIQLSGNDGVWRALDGPARGKELAVKGSVRPTAPGLYSFSGKDVKKIFAVNTPAEESDLSPWPNPDQLAALESLESAVTTAKSTVLRDEWTAVENQQRNWWWLLAFGGCIFLGELVLANRAIL